MSENDRTVPPAELENGEWRINDFRKQATNYIRMGSSDDKYSMIYTINITCMMVLASIYLSVSASLPITSDMKPVEVWLLFNLAYPLLVMLTNIVLQVCEF